MTESQATTKLKNQLLKHGLFWKSSDRFVAGIPDIIGCVDGKFVCIEMKRDSGTITKLQSFFMDKVEDNNGVAMVVRYRNKTEAWYLHNSKEPYNLDQMVDIILDEIRP